MSTEPTPESPLGLPPATRTAIIFVLIAVCFVGLTVLWVGREASRIKKQRDATFAANRDARGKSGGEMVWIRPGSFTMGGIGDQVPPDELPLHDVKLDGFWIDRTEVTNDQYEAFVKATGYVTVAERPLSATTTPGLLPEFEGKGASLCFREPQPGEQLDGAYQWWTPVVGANWRHPEGPNSDIKSRGRHPVVHVAHEDALAYCKWAGKRLPTEAEWEYAARGGLIAQPYVWGREMKPGGAWLANIWQGRFPLEHRVEDGFKGTAPVASYPGNGYGLHDMSGNVWEITNDWYRPDYYATIAKNPAHASHRNPKGPDDSHDPDEPGAWKKVTRGGSFMCADNYCRGYRPSARMKTAADTGLQNTGFRCVKDATPQAPGKS